MTEKPGLLPAIYAGWSAYQTALSEALGPLDEGELGLRAGPKLRTVDQIARHIIGARAGWFYGLMDEGGESFKSLSNWGRRGRNARTAEELVDGLERTWEGMQAAMDGWSAEDWQTTWPGRPDYGPEVITRPWVIWHLIEHDLHHGGEISLTLGAHGIKAVSL